MNIKLRPLPILLSLVISSIVLFGGWFVYNSVAIENPLSKMIEQVPGVETMKLNLSSDNVNIELTVAPQANLQEIYQEIITKGASTIGKRQVNMSIINKSSLTLDQLWSDVMFDVAQAMETKHYSDIPLTLQKLTANHKNLTFKADMDQTNVYIRLNEGENSKFIIMPRTPAMMGMLPL